MAESAELDAQVAERVRIALKLSRFYAVLTVVQMRQLFPVSGLHRYAAGETILRQGEASQDLHIVHSGSVKVTRSKGSETSDVAALGPGGTFGEMAIMRGGFRSANIIAAEESLVFRLSRADVARLLMANPELGRHLKELASSRLE